MTHPGVDLSAIGSGNRRMTQTGIPASPVRSGRVRPVPVPVRKSPYQLQLWFPRSRKPKNKRYDEGWQSDFGNRLTVSENTKTESYCKSVKMSNLTIDFSETWTASYNPFEPIIVQPVPTSSLTATCIFKNSYPTDEINCCYVSSCTNINTGKP
jgi:hypothetical protein